MTEYKIYEGIRLAEYELNDYAKDGWSLCQVLVIPMYAQTNRVMYHYIFERKAK